MILQEFLVCGLIAIGDEDTRLEWLDAAAGSLAKDYLKHKRKLVNATLVALDDELPESEPVFEEVEAVVLKHWKALRGKYPDRPRQILRAVIFAALDKVREDSTAAAIVWLVGGSYLPYARMKKERPIVERLITELAEIGETAAVAFWEIVRAEKELKIPGLSLKLENLKAKAVDEAWLQERLGAAAGDGQNVDGFPNNTHRIAGNGYGQGGNQPQWASHFANVAAKAIKGQVDGVVAPTVKEFANALAGLEEPLKEYGTAISTAVRDAIRQGMESQLGQERRTALLWWRQTLYSPSRRRGYRGLTPGGLVALMAFDLHRMIPSMAPQSVEFLLREAVRETIAGIAKIPGEELLVEMKAATSIVSPTEWPGRGTSESAGRICLAAFCRETLEGRAAPAELGSRVGLPPDRALPIEEWAVWLFRDFQALRLAVGK